MAALTANMQAIIDRRNAAQASARTFAPAREIGTRPEPRYFGPLHTPYANPLARPFKKSDGKDVVCHALTTAEYVKLDTIARACETENRRRLAREGYFVGRAADTHLSDPEKSGRHCDDEISRKAACFYPRGPPNEVMMGRILHKVSHLDKSNYNEHRKYLGVWQSHAKHDTLGFGLS
ncbi:hypothetical protein LTR17_002960 [Elasticomyces elasticus]|nr:hypothetical protein LTR17_002960 [Elasticomyces elasticus]